MNIVKALGIMSGSSLDGVDIAYCEFGFDKVWNFMIIKSETVPYDEHWRNTLQHLDTAHGETLCKTDIEYGNLLSDIISDFVKKNDLVPDIISSHGHTIYHNPAKYYTLQIGNGQVIATKTGIKTITDYRIKDITLGGHGAPLVPIGDQLLFSEYDFCINIGGIANISFLENDKRVAFDICPSNQLLNYLSMQVGKTFDYNGNIAQLGKLDKDLFNKLNDHPYYKLSYPKSISNQLVNNEFIPILNNSNTEIANKLYTTCKHIAYQINEITKIKKNPGILITGGGAHNGFLVNAIKYETLQNIIVPDKTIINYKEALIFAFMGVLNMKEKINCLSSATGASRDSICGVLYKP